MINNRFFNIGAKVLGLKTFRNEGRNPQILFTIFHFLFLISYLSFPTDIYAQQTFTERLTRSSAGEGTVTLHQDAEIEALVNGLSITPKAPKSIASIISQWNDTTATSDSLSYTPTRRVRTMGYRIQVYAGGNTRSSKSEAYHVASLVRLEFPELSVYTHFISPRWVCRAGDFKTNEEAREMLQRMRQTHKFREASIVKSKIIAYQ